jgi:hypothetical protein
VADFMLSMCKALDLILRAPLSKAGTQGRRPCVDGARDTGPSQGAPALGRGQDSLPLGHQREHGPADFSILQNQERNPHGV